ncbi:MAG: arylsulfatase [Hydrogenophaga sp.]|uniref:arylsulfatase n=1 Tax=Hydrogenophaga sp. TaxID=1904254 RepID=UPI0027328775|nr:arylsulfatase [Hydrogenophaga sp.]MDP3626434.1 arylsulfatase [Hydrogenophaga sp.]
MNPTHEFKGTIGKTYKDSVPWWPDKVAPPAGAPNIVFVVLDDVGYSDIGCYGSEIATPRMDELAAKGARYSNFHVTSMCSPTRACLLTGRNSHTVGVGIIAEWSSGFPGYSGQVSNAAATIPEVLGQHAYGSYAVGKWHLTNIADYGSAGPHDNWPIGKGFSRWYGFHGALTDQWNPELCQDNRPIRLEKPENYHLSTDLVNHAITDVRDHLSSAQQRPFFLYLAFGACHWPHHVPQEYIDRYKGRYDGGWDGIRAERLQKQIRLGVVPPNTTLAQLNPGVQPWTELTTDLKTLFTRLQETYAGFLEHTDSEIGRLVDYLDSVGQLDNTLFVLLSDNGASAEGGPTGAINLRKHMVYEKESPEVGLANLDKIGSEMAYNHYPTGWAQVSNTPLKWYKKGTHGGGVRAPLILHWPGKINDEGAIRHQFHHVIDLAPTVYDILNVQAPQTYKGTPQLQIHGISMAYTLIESAAPTRKQTQIFELLGDRAIWHGGWKAVARHPKDTDFEADEWELYCLDKDYAEINDLAMEQPSKLKEMVELWWVEARKYGVLPLDDRDWERAAARLKMHPVAHYELHGDMARIDRLTSPDITDRSYRIKATFDDARAPGVEGVILAWGSHFGGFVLFIKDGTLSYEYVYSESVTHTLQVGFQPASDKGSIELRFQRQGKNAGAASLYVDGVELGSVAIPRTWPTHGTTAGLNCGLDAGAPVSRSYEAPFSFTGTSLRVFVDLDMEGGAEPGAVFTAAIREQ